ncbi:DUF488 domain-containing protein [Nitrospira sp. BLG_2]|uniref:DUF488 domain-containing protein n=1 Tax=Nitrospira sp. BLG_2 TaxID=3397507 RepID=UPI003B9DA978
MGKILVKRVYEPAAKSDGFRVLVDRLWPRGLSKESAHIDLWLRDIGPSTELRKWFNHDPARWAEFQRRYYAELKEKATLLATIKKHAKTKPVTLLYSAKDEQHNQAVALRSFLLKRPSTRQPDTRSTQSSSTAAHREKRT